MVYRVAADFLFVLHLAFIVFVCAGGWLVAKRPRWAWLHLPAVLWGAWVEFTGWICPLTPWEWRLRTLAGQQGHSGGFVEHYLVKIIYPPGLTPGIQLALGCLVVLLNTAFYTYTWRRWRRIPPHHPPNSCGKA